MQAHVLLQLHPGRNATAAAASPGQWLDQNGWNLASVIAGTRQSDEQAFQRVSSYLSVVVPEITAVNVGRYGDYETVRFQMGSDDKTMHFDAFSMSDGTLRAIGALMAAFRVFCPNDTLAWSASRNRKWRCTRGDADSWTPSMMLRSGPEFF